MCVVQIWDWLRILFVIVGGDCFFFFKQKTAYEIGTGDWSSDVCSSDLALRSVAPQTLSMRFAGPASRLSVELTA